MADYAAEIEVRSDGEVKREEITNYDELQDYLANGTYPKGATKAVKPVVRKREKKVQLVDGVLHYKEILKTGELRLRQVTYCSYYLQCVHNMICCELLCYFAGYQRAGDNLKCVGLYRATSSRRQTME